MDWAEILPNLYVGNCPMSLEDVDELVDELGPTAVLCLQTDEDFRNWQIDWPKLAARYGERGVELRRVPIRDFDPLDLRANLRTAVDTLAELLAAGHKVYLHCTAGSGRSPSVAIAYLHWHKGMELEEAVQHVQQRRPCTPDVDAIRDVAAELEAERGRS